MEMGKRGNDDEERTRSRARKEHGLEEGGMGTNVSLPSIRAPPPDSLDLGRGNTRGSKESSTTSSHRVPTNGGSGEEMFQPGEKPFPSRWLS
jgi:hypothetical protein